MKITAYLITFLIVSPWPSSSLIGQDLDSLAENVEYEISQVGVYQGKPLFIHNPYVRTVSSFCINDILINDISWDVPLNKPAVEISFNESYMYKPVVLRLKHKSNCVPRILNPDAIVIHSSFKFEEVSLNDSILSWYTKGDRSDGEYTIEHLDVDEWIQDTTMLAKGVFAGITYEYYPLLKSGVNKFRIKYTLPSGRYLYSKELEHSYYPDEVTISPLVVVDKLTLSRAVSWEITTTEGRVLLTGSTNMIPLRRLPSGDYYIRLGEDQIESFIKK